jgi:hypothetical protein
MENLFDQLEVGSELQTRETKSSPWLTVTVIEIDGDHITMQNDDIGEVNSDREEINDLYFFRPIDNI